MNCQEFWNGMPELANNPAHLAHLQTCSKCTQWSHRQSLLAAGLRAVASESRRVEAPARVETRLIAAYRGHAGLGTVSPAALGAPRMWVPVATWFAVAAAVVALALVLVNHRLPQPVHRSPPGVLETAAAHAPGDLEPADDSPYNSGDYIPLPNAQQIAPNEDVNLVRVEVPRSTMIALGYDVSADRASEPVEAEVVIGPDGLARAVRFLE